MDELLNPYAPGAGSRPVELAGRDTVIAEVDIALARTRMGRAGRHHVLVGLRGVGKTVLLDHLYRRAVNAGAVCVKLEAPEGRRLADLLAPQLKRVLLEIDRRAGRNDAVRRAVGALRNFASVFKVKIGDFDISVSGAEPAIADTGDLDLDLRDLLDAIGAAAEGRDTALAIFLDEIQYLHAEDLGPFIAALHHVQQMQRPILFVGAGLPQVRGLMGEAKSYSERLVRFVSIDALDQQAATLALERPAQTQAVAWSPDALNAVVDLTRGYPYFLQEWGSQCWRAAASSPITLSDVETATPLALAELDDSFFRVRLDRVTPREREYLRAMAALENGHHIRSGQVAQALSLKSPSAAPIRDSLIRKGMIFASDHGTVAFTVPLFGDYLRRTLGAAGAAEQ